MSTRLRHVTRLLIAVFAVTVLAWAPGSGLTPSAAAACSDAKLTINDETSFGGTSWVICYPDNIANLANASSNPWGCHGGVFTYDTLNDCMSSVKVENANCHYRILLYINSNYSNRMTDYSSWGNWTDNNMGSYNDSLSSLKWDYRASCTGGT